METETETEKVEAKKENWPNKSETQLIEALEAVEPIEEKEEVKPKEKTHYVREIVKNGAGEILNSCFMLIQLNIILVSGLMFSVPVILLATLPAVLNVVFTAFSVIAPVSLLVINVKLVRVMWKNQKNLSGSRFSMPQY